ncbi:MAG: hypothetical protein U9N11_03270 [Campylobacterota bacterium]|nr:hypothetical protein [Campylobacterota bacterium]
MEGIVSDSTTIITLTNISRVDVLSNLFDKIYIPEKVYEEIVQKENVMLDDTFFIKKVIEDKGLCHLLGKSLDSGESEAIVLAKEMGLRLLIDEKKGRKIAFSMDVKIIGLIGLLMLNVKHNKLSSNEVLNVYRSVKSDGFRVGHNLEDNFIDYVKSFR